MMNARGVICARWFWAFLLTALLVACGGPGENDFQSGEPLLVPEDPVEEAAWHPGDSGKGVHVGFIDVACRAMTSDCRPLAGVTVQTSTGALNVTDEEGFALISVPDNIPTVVVQYQKEGFDKEKRLVKLKDDRMASAVVLSRAAEPLELDNPGAGGTVTFAGGSITFPPNSFWGVGDEAMETLVVKVRVIDVEGNDIANAPGDFSGIAADGSDVWLESYGMISVVMENADGVEVSFTKSGHAKVELVLPESARFRVGDEVPAWHFDETSEKWIEEGHWEVAPWSQDPEQLVIKATVTHFSWWNADNPMEVTCIRGRVTLCDGRPASYVKVSSVGQDYSSVIPGYTGGDGDYCLLARVGSTVELSAALFDGFEFLYAKSPSFNTTNQAATCSTPFCTEIDLVLPCVEVVVSSEEDMLCAM